MEHTALSVIKDVATIFQAIAVGAAAIAGLLGIREWRANLRAEAQRFAGQGLKRDGS